MRDEFFSLLRYHSLKSCHDRRKETLIFSKVEEISKAKAKILPLDQDNNHDLSTWRTRPVHSLSSDGTVHPILVGREFREDKPEEYEDDTDTTRDKTAEDREYCFTSLGIFTNSIAFNLWTLFIGFDPYESEDSITEVSFFTIPRLDAWIATIVQLLEENEKRGGGRQKNYSTHLAINMKRATFNLIDNIFEFAKYWIPGELTIPDSVPEGDFKNYVLHGVEREGTVVLHSERNRTYYIALTASWFTDYISSHCGFVRDCFIAMVARDWRSIIPISEENNGVLDNSPNGPNYEDDDEITDPPVPSSCVYQEDEEDDTPGCMEVDSLPGPA